MTNINDTLSERGKTHGRYSEVAGFAQGMKALMHAMPNWEELSSVQCEALDMVASKIGRVLSGNHNERDHWLDIVGYAQLVVLELEMEQNVAQLQPERRAAEADSSGGATTDWLTGALHRIGEFDRDRSEPGNPPYE